MEKATLGGVAFSYIWRHEDVQAAVDEAYIRDNTGLMAVSQSSFAYTEKELEILIESISLERLQMYLSSIRSHKDETDRLRQAIRFYERNTELSQALYPVVQAFEVTLRNAIHARLTQQYTDTWFNTLPFQPSEREAVETAIQTIQNKPQTVTPDRVVAELSFGFWIRLFSADYATLLWGTSLSKLITPATNDRRAVYSRFQEIKTLRNRIAHHNRIVGRVPTVEQSNIQILETIGWFSLTVSVWVASTNSLQEKLTRKTLAKLPVKLPLESS